MIFSAAGIPLSSEGREFIATRKNEIGFILYGPYEAFGPGRYSLAIKAQIPPVDRASVSDDVVCCMVDIVSDFAATVIADRQVFASSLKEDDATILLDFDLQDVKTLEFRCYSTGAAPLIVERRQEVVPRSTDHLFSPILENDNDPHDEFFAANFRRFLDFHLKGAKISPRADGTIVSLFGISLKVRNIEDCQLIYEILIKNVYNFNTDGDVCVLDVGMNVGLASLYFAQLPSVKMVHSFEPFEPPFARAMLNFALNPELSTKISAHNFGLGKDTQTLSVLYDKEQTIGGSVRGRSNGENIEISIRNASEVFREILREAKQLGLQLVVKLDCEGSEFPILERLDEDGLLPEARIYLLEWHKWWSAEKTQAELISRFLRNGFDVLDHTDPFDPFAGGLYAIRAARP